MKPIIETGKMNRYVVIFQRVKNPPSSSGAVTYGTPNNLGNYWVSIEPAKSWDIERAKGIQVQCTHVIRTWLPEGITIDGTCYLTYNGRTFNFTGVINDHEKDATLTIFATEQTT